MVDVSGLGGGGVGDFRRIGETERGEDGRSWMGSDLAATADVDGIWIFNGGGGIIPFVRSMFATIGRDIEISEPSLLGAGARRLITFGTGFDPSFTEKYAYI